MKRFLLFSFVLGALLMPHVSQAAIDSRCWQQSACIEQRRDSSFVASLTEQEILDGFIQNETTIASCGKIDAAKKELGFCLPAVNAKTKTTFGSQNVFTDIGEFIVLMYRYGIITAGVLAILMIIMAGFIWTTSGGNSERIGSAKKKIAGALMGLFLAVLSYSLLDLINPALVNIRLPQVWMINTQGIAPPYCDSMVPPKKILPLGPKTMTEEEIESKKKNPPAVGSFTSSTPSSDTAVCGVPHFVESAGDLICTGRICDQDKGKGPLCVKYKEGEQLKKELDWRCMDSNLMISVKLTGFWTTLLSTFDGVSQFLETVEVEGSWIDKTRDDPTFWPVCERENGQLYNDGIFRSQDWDSLRPEKRILETIGTSSSINPKLHDYDIIFFKLNLEDSYWCKQRSDRTYDTFKGLFVMIEVKEKGDNTDPDLWIGQAEPKENNPTSAVVGTWLDETREEKGTAMKYSDYIPKENIAKGVQLDVLISDRVFQTIEEYTGDSDRNQMPFVEKGRPIRCTKAGDDKKCVSYEKQ